MVLTRRAFALGTLVSAAMVGSAHATTSVWQGRAFGSTWRLVTAEPLSNAALTSIEEIIAKVDGQMSPYREGSDLSRFNAHRGDEWQRMPSALCEVTREALEIARFTGGAFDPTVGPAVNRFGFGPIHGASARFEDVSVEGAALAKRDATLTLDLCGIAKGYALDQIVLALRAQGVGDLMFELGGEVRTHGLHPSGRDWRIAIEAPNGGAFDAQFVVIPGDKALATSGHHANGRSANELGGPTTTSSIATSHIIDPQSGRPVDQFSASVSVLSETAMRADALATALTAMGSHGPHFADEHGVSALFILAQPSSDMPILTGGFATHILA